MHNICLIVFQSFLGGLFSPVCEIDVILNDAESRKTTELKTEEGKLEKHYLFYDGESVSGKVSEQTPVLAWEVFILKDSLRSLSYVTPR